MKRVIAFIISGTLAVCAFSRDFTVEWEKYQSIKTLPQTDVAAVFNITNKSNSPLDTALDMLLPPGWNFIVEPLPMNIPGNTSNYFLANFYIPGNTLPGDYMIPFRIFNPGSPADSFQEVITVTVMNRITFDIQVVRCPDFIVSGESYPIVYQIINTGNGNVALQLLTKSSSAFDFTMTAGSGADSYPLDANNRRLDFSPGQEQVLTVTINTGKNLTRVEKHHFTLTAQYFDETIQQTIEKNAITTVEVIPVVSKWQDINHYLPLEITARINQQYNTSYSGDLSLNLESEGSIDDEGFHNIGVMLNKNLNLITPQLTDPEDTYRLQYKNPFLRCISGDYNFGLSPLTENLRSGRGIELDGFLNSMSMTAYYQQNRNAPPADHFIGGNIKYWIPGKNPDQGFRYKAALNAFTQVGNDYILGLYQEFYPIPQINVNLETALGALSGENVHYAVNFQASGSHGWINYGFHSIFSQPGYPGSIRDMYLVAGNTGLTLLAKQLRLSLQFRQEGHNLDMNPQLNEALQDRMIQTGVEYIYTPFSTRSAFSWKLEDRMDMLPGPAYSLYENTFTLNIVQPVHNFQLTPNITFILTHDRLTNKDALNQNYVLGLDYAPGNRYRCNAFLGFNRSADDKTGNRFKWGFGTNLNFNPLSIGLNFKNEYILDTDLKDSSFSFSLYSSCDFKDAGKITANIDGTITGGLSALENSISGSLGYTKKINLPVSKKSNIGSLSGRIFNTITEQPLAGIILRIGNYSAISNESGRYTFPVLVPGEYYIDLNRAGIPGGMIPSLPFPAKITIKNRINSVLDIGLIQASQCTGVIKIFKQVEKNSFNTGEQTFTEEPVPGLIMELSNNKEIKRTVSGKNGVFVFDELEPGTWTLKILPYNIPENYRTETNSREIEFKPGEVKEVVFAFHYIKKDIEILEEGDLSIIE